MKKLPFFFFFLFGFCFGVQVIKEIVFNGNHSFKDTDLLTVTALQTGEELSFPKIGLAAANLSQFYLKRRFFAVVVEDPEVVPLNPEEVRLVFTIEENRELTISNIHLRGNSYLSENKLGELLGLSAKVHYTPRELSLLLDQLVELYADRGFLLARAEVDSLVLRQETLTAYIGINEGKLCRSKTFRVIGNKVSRAQTIIRLSNLVYDQPLTYTALKQAEENIRRRPYITDCEITPINERDVQIDVTEGSMTKINGLVGFDTKNKNEVSGFFRGDFYNLWGTDRLFSFYWQKQGESKHIINLNYHETGFEKIPVKMDLAFNREEADSTYIKLNVESKIYYENFLAKLGIVVGSQEVYPGSRRPEVIEKNVQRKFGVFGEYDDTDYQLNPRHGQQASVGYYTLFAEENGKSKKINASELKGCKYFSLRRNLVLCTKAEVNIKQNKQLEQYDLFPLGGANSLRGYAESEFYGYRTFLSSTELRFLVGRQARIFLFSDYGAFTNIAGKTVQNLLGIGFGLRLPTRLGQVGVDYGLPYRDSRFANPLDGMIHISLEMFL